MESFDKELFMELCKKYNVTLSKTSKSPMIKDKYGVHVIDEYDPHFSNDESILLAAHSIIENTLRKMIDGEYSSELYTFGEYEIAKEVVGELFCTIRKSNEREVSYEE